CEVIPAKEASGTGRPELPVKIIRDYNYLDEPTEVAEVVGSVNGPTRKSLTTYDEAGRPRTTKVVGGGVELARTEASTKTVYDPGTGLVTGEEFVCEAKTGCAGFD